MLKIGFAFSERKTYYEHVKEREDIKLQRASYIRYIREHRSAGREIFYQDETWVFKNIAQSKVWMFEQMDFTYKVPSGVGQRSIISHLGSSKHGLLDGSLLLYRGAKSNKNADYHSEMNHKVFLDWCEKTVFPRLQAIGNCVLVIDRAKYHLILTEETKPATSGMKKGEIAAWIKRHNVKIPDD